jgi:hypothetical protein
MPRPRGVSLYFLFLFSFVVASQARVTSVDRSPSESFDTGGATLIAASLEPKRTQPLPESHASGYPPKTKLQLGALAAFHYDSNVDLAPDVARFPFTPGGAGGKAVQLGLEPDKKAQASWTVLSGFLARYPLQKTDFQCQSLFGQVVLRYIEALREERLLAGGGYTLWRGLGPDNAVRLTGSFYYREFNGDAVGMGQALVTYRHRLALGSIDLKAELGLHSFENYTAANGEKYSFGVDWNLPLSRALSIRLGGSAAHYKARAATSTYRDLSFRVGLNAQLHPKWTLFADWRLARRDYAAVNPALARERLETVHTGQIGLRQRIQLPKRPPLLLTHSIRFLDIQSSNPAFERQRQVIGTELRLPF